MPDLDAFDAREALDNGNVAVLCAYLAELQANLSLIGELLDPGDEQASKLVFSNVSRKLDGTCQGAVANDPETANRADPSAQGSPGIEDNPPEPEQGPLETQSEDDWTGSTSQLHEAIENQRTSPIGLYLREASGLLKRLGAVIDTSPSTREPWHFSIQRRSRGKPSNRQEVKLKNDHIAMLVWFEKNRLGKLEAAVHSISQLHGYSRATIMCTARSF